MRFKRFISVNAEPDVLRRLRKEGVPINDPDNFANVFMWEDDPKWPIVESVTRHLDTFRRIDTEFSRQELDSSAYVTNDYIWTAGYPVPEEGYKELVYDLSDYCKRCGAGLVQEAPFRMSGEPKWRSRSFMSLNGVPARFFMRPEVYSTVFKPLGLGCWPVLNKRGDRELETVVQLKVDIEVELDLPPGLRSWVCPVCGRLKYWRPSYGFQPGPAVETDAPVFKAAQNYGCDSYQAYKEVCFSHAVYEEIVRLRLRGFEFAACKRFTGG